MKTLILGPTRTRVLDEPPEEVIARLASWIDGGSCPYDANHRGVHFQFAIRKRLRKRWSPHLTLEVRDLATSFEDVIDTTAPVSAGAGAIAERLTDPPGPDAGPGADYRMNRRTHPSSAHGGADSPPPGIGTGRTEVFGRFNPSPGIWTGYMLATLSLFTLIFGALMWGGAELMLGDPPRALWLVPACVAVLVVMWTISALGQHLARDDMAAMWGGVEGALAGDDQARSLELRIGRS